MKVILVMFKADGTRRDFPMKKSRVVIGRKNTCDLRIPLHSVSRQHCELLIEDDALRLRDLGSSNGTFHNSKRIQEAVLKPGDELAVGPVIFIMSIDGEPKQIKPVRTVIEDSDATGSMILPAAKSDQAKADESGSLSRDESPIAALEALAEQEDDSDEAGNKDGEIADLPSDDNDNDDNDDSGEFEFLTEDDDKLQG